eukprot:TRINITY_DN58025_c0_g1_i1.p1 TRINITY_DN58025_c0_g1~~TRINITY_DN58025_c0_g1_i1.p1  ORF type:complete len:430 (+),score=81.79 TRINITY_DN58025_c0_g1_i1:102-1391(+)
MSLARCLLECAPVEVWPGKLPVGPRLAKAHPSPSAKFTRGAKSEAFERLLGHKVYTFREKMEMSSKVTALVNFHRERKQMNAACYTAVLDGVAKHRLPPHYADTAWEHMLEDGVTPPVIAYAKYISGSLHYARIYQEYVAKGLPKTHVIQISYLKRAVYSEDFAYCFEVWLDILESHHTGQLQMQDVALMSLYKTILKACKTSSQVKLICSFMRNKVFVHREIEPVVCTASLKVATTAEEVERVFAWFFKTKHRVTIGHVTAYIQALGRVGDFKTFAVGCAIPGKLGLAVDARHYAGMVSACRSFLKREVAAAAAVQDTLSLRNQIDIQPFLALTNAVVARALDTGNHNRQLMLESACIFLEAGSHAHARKVIRTFRKFGVADVTAREASLLKQANNWFIANQKAMGQGGLLHWRLSPPPLEVSDITEG